MANFFVAQPDIGVEGAGKQERVLEDDTELAPKVVHGVPANVHAIQKDFASLNFVKAQQELDKRGFSGAGVADDGQRLAWRDAEGDIAPHPVFLRGIWAAGVCK